MVKSSPIEAVVKAAGPPAGGDGAAPPPFGTATLSSLFFSALSSCLYLGANQWNLFFQLMNSLVFGISHVKVNPVSKL